jgi:hypothetical protein
MDIVVGTPERTIDEPSSLEEDLILPPPPAKQFVRQKIDINELKRSINESLKKQTEVEKAPAQVTPPNDPSK